MALLRGAKISGLALCTEVKIGHPDRHCLGGEVSPTPPSGPTRGEGSSCVEAWGPLTPQLPTLFRFWSAPDHTHIGSFGSSSTSENRRWVAGKRGDEVQPVLFVFKPFTLEEPDIYSLILANL